MIACVKSGNVCNNSIESMDHEHRSFLFDSFRVVSHPMIYPMYALHTLNAIPCYPRYFIVHLGSLHLDLLALDLLPVRKVKDLIFDVCS